MIPAYTKHRRSSSGHRYWRVRCPTTYESGNYMACAELAMHATIGGSNMLTPSSTMTASATISGYPTSNAVDGNPSTFWTTGGTAPPSGGHWLACDFGSGAAVTVAEVVYTVRPDTYREDPASLYVDYSDNGTTWTNAWSVSSIPSWTAGQTRTFS
ncbi:discoidin domain-containing protein [Paraburkholderia pallida]|uniref:Discoidin domain-containing protein n=1 Tax=Paraburkholderia pallida TaxID=2547399 RepID=A0A4P7CKS3_9BURK|nr:discoidin domain-containing protein [Paraburkholderia pallida]